MKETTLGRNGANTDVDPDAPEQPFEEASQRAVFEPARPTRRLVAGKPRPVPEVKPPAAPAPDGERRPCGSSPCLALFCYEPPASLVGQHVSKLVRALARRQTPVHLFSRQPFDLDLPEVTLHPLGESDEPGLVDQVQEFTRRACNTFQQQFPPGSARVTLLGCEWSSVPALSLLRATKNHDALLSLHSLERQRSDMSSEVSGRIDDIERAGLREARSVLIHDPAIEGVAKSLVPECGERLVPAWPAFPVDRFSNQIDPGFVKGRFNVGPVDPTILFVGDLNDAHGPDVLVKSMPAILKNNKQARLVIVGDGALMWPLRVYARYLLIEHAVRLVGHLEGQAMFELMQAADVVAVPSRSQTEWWPVQAAWSANRPVVASQAMAPGLELENEQDSVLIYPHESSCVWGIERILFDPELGRRIAARGAEKVEERFGWSTVARRVEALIGVPQAR